MLNVKLNRNPLQYGGTIKAPTTDAIKNTFGLWNASLEDALRYGGDLTKAALSAMNLKFDRKYIIVDTKVHMLMPEMCPAIPSWHTDGVPRGADLNPASKGAPNLSAQETMDAPRFHLLVTGEGCLTEFVNEQNVEFEIDEDYGTSLYSQMNRQVTEKLATGEITKSAVPANTAVEFDWWDLHTGTWATKHEWRYLIRVTETNHIPPQTDLSKIIRTQQNVYVKENFGW